MKVDFNNLRLNLIREYNALVGELNNAIVEDVDMNRVIVPVTDIVRELDNIRTSLVTLGSLYEEGDEECKVVLTDDIKLKIFNEEK